MSVCVVGGGGWKKLSRLKIRSKIENKRRRRKKGTDMAEGVFGRERINI